MYQEPGQAIAKSLRRLSHMDEATSVIKAGCGSAINSPSVTTHTQIAKWRCRSGFLFDMCAHGTTHQLGNTLIDRAPRPGLSDGDASHLLHSKPCAVDTTIEAWCSALCPWNGMRMSHHAPRLYPVVVRRNATIRKHAVEHAAAYLRAPSVRHEQNSIPCMGNHLLRC